MSLFAIFDLGRWIINIIKRLNANLTQWNVSADVKPKVDKVYETLKLDMLKEMGINLLFQVEKNSCRQLLSYHNHDKLVNLLKVEENETKVRNINLWN